MNNRDFLDEVVSLLEKSGINTWIFGGWAEELLGITEPRIHNDVDLLYLAIDFSVVDKLFTEDVRLQEISAKHFPHKRAFIYKGTMVELFLVQRINGKLLTNFWGEKLYYWPEETLSQSTPKKRIASKSSLILYRRDHNKLTK